MRKQGMMILALMAALVPLAGAQAPPASPSQVLLDSWNEMGRALIAMAEGMPEGNYDFRPAPAGPTFAEHLLNAAGTNYYFINPARGLGAPQGNPRRADFKSKSAVVQFVRKSFADGANVIQSQGDAGLNNLMVDPISHRQVRVGDYAWTIIEQSAEHFGQLVVYYRVAGLVPPERR